MYCAGSIVRRGAKAHELLYFADILQQLELWLP
jgi:hypothetical protein